MKLKNLDHKIVLSVDHFAAQEEDAKVLCLLCKEPIQGSSLEEHVRESHRIGHEGALAALLSYIRREEGRESSNGAGGEFHGLRPPEGGQPRPGSAPPSPATSRSEENIGGIY